MGNVVPTVMEDMEEVSEANANGGLPEDVWRVIVSHLPDYELARKVMPLNKIFRELAYSVGFRRCGDSAGNVNVGGVTDTHFDVPGVIGGDIDAGGVIGGGVNAGGYRVEESVRRGANLGHDWLVWHPKLHPDFLDRLHSFNFLNRLEFVDSTDFERAAGYARRIIYPFHNRLVKFNLGIIRFNPMPNPESSRFYVERTWEEKTTMVEVVRAFPELETLKVVYKFDQDFEGPDRLPISDASTIRFSEGNDCPTATARFLVAMLSPVQLAVKDLELDLACYCRPDGQHVRVKGEDGQSRHASFSETHQPVFRSLLATPISDCKMLRSLCLCNALDGPAFELFAALPNLTKLTLQNCELLRESDLQLISNRVSEGALSRLESLHLRELFVNGEALNNFFTSNAIWAGALLSLGIHFGIGDLDEEDDEDPVGFDLNPIFQVSVKLRQLTIDAPLSRAPDFEALTQLTSLDLAYYRTQYIMPNADPLEAPAPWNTIAPLTSLTISMDNLPLLTYVSSWRRLFGNLRSLKLSQNGGVDDSDMYSLIKSILSVCAPTLKSFAMGFSYSGEPLEITDDYQFESLALVGGGDVMLKNVPSSSFRLLASFEYVGRETNANVAFILRVCEAAASTLRHLKLKILAERLRFDFGSTSPNDSGRLSAHLKDLEFLSFGMRKLEFLQCDFSEDSDGVADRESLNAFVLACNRIFPVRINEGEFIDELSEFPAMRYCRLGLNTRTNDFGWDDDDEVDDDVDDEVDDDDDEIDDDDDSAPDTDVGTGTDFLAVPNESLFSGNESDLADDSAPVTDTGVAFGTGTGHVCAYNLRKTCFGKIKRYLVWEGKDIIYRPISPTDVTANNTDFLDELFDV